MKQLRRLLSSPAVTVGAFALAACLLAFSTIGGTRAALTYYSENYVSTVQMHELGVSLVENGAVVATGNAVTSARAAREGEQMSALLGTLILEQSGAAEPASEPFKLGAVYREQLAVHNPKNNGADAAAGAANITQYVRVTIRRYWVKPNGAGGWTKAPELDPDLIELGLAEGNGWVEDADARTRERTVLYYTRPLAPDETTPVFSRTLRIDPSVSATVSRTENGGTVTDTYIYDGAAFQLEVRVDAVQDHNAADAILSAWGRSVLIDADGTLRLD